MKVYILKNKNGDFASVNCAAADDGFRKMGWEIVPFSRLDRPCLRDLTPADVVVGFIEDANAALLHLGIESPPEINYPDELTSFLGRKIWRSRINYIAKHPELWNIFIKPTTLAKKFTGRLLTSAKDLISCGDEFEDTEIWCSEPVKFLAEWRCFVRYGEILGVKSYYGDWRLHFDSQIIENAIAAYTSAPAGYAADFGVTDKGETLLIEVNDGYAIGAYGLFAPDYARLLASRWAQITGSRDYSIY
ncbi:ATP-grasp domain-containing protein [Chamaesiphon sp. VAR_48_metabat_403]|uniref:ATP-grasp domain-containing protein n=1 Tax=Chamaesiphon sp. VAR_48_metabat_403 TaxID=2964700 RepID=UPI00286E4070|nr:ATP-grasp domain-containing protein [Chamaesiphon sp. VAR_48_metabat_403]